MLNDLHLIYRKINWNVGCMWMTMTWKLLWNILWLIHWFLPWFIASFNSNDAEFCCQVYSHGDVEIVDDVSLFVKGHCVLQLIHQVLTIQALKLLRVIIHDGRTAIDGVLTLQTTTCGCHDGISKYIGQFYTLQDNLHIISTHKKSKL